MDLARFTEPNAYSSLEGAIASLHSDNSYATPNRFEVLITRPGSSATESKNVSMRCESINLPGRNLNSGTDSNIYGPTREVVNGVTYADDINMTFHASSGLEERIFFEEWQELAFNKRSWNVGYYNNYISTIDIYLLDRGGKPAVSRQPSTVPGSGGKPAPAGQDKRRFGLKLHEAFPKTIGATELSQSANNELIKLAVTFSFRYWTTLDLNRGAAGGVNDDASRLNVNSVERNNLRNHPATISKLDPIDWR